MVEGGGQDMLTPPRAGCIRGMPPRSHERGYSMPTTTLPGGTFTMGGDLTVTRMGYGAMRLAGPHVFGPGRP